MNGKFASQPEVQEKMNDGERQLKEIHNDSSHVGFTEKCMFYRVLATVICDHIFFKLDFSVFFNLGS